MLQNQLPVLPIAKHHQIVTVALGQPWSDSVTWSPPPPGTQQPAAAAARRHSLMPVKPLGHLGPGPLRRATADISVTTRKRASSNDVLPMSYTAHQATATKQQFDQLQGVDGETAKLPMSSRV